MLDTEFPPELLAEKYRIIKEAEDARAFDWLDNPFGCKDYKERNDLGLCKFYHQDFTSGEPYCEKWVNPHGNFGINCPYDVEITEEKKICSTCSEYVEDGGLHICYAMAHEKKQCLNHNLWKPLYV
jgi:hypothetical protein